MASSEMASVDQWSLRSYFNDPWFCEALSRDTQTLTKALTKSLSDSSSDFFTAADCIAADPFSPFFAKPEAQPTTPAVSNVSGGSDPEPAATTTAINKRQRSAIPVSGKVTKRKPRASKRSQTTFITADPANFRQMVQQVTGVRFGGCSQSQLQAAAGILKPEPQRPGGQLGLLAGGCLPTLDTSAFLLDRNLQQQKVDIGAGATSPPSAGAAALPYVAVADGGCTGGLDFDSFASFPTLESWNAM